MPDQLDCIAVGAHPDDVEIGCGGCLARLGQQGYRVGIVDLTDGEPTPGSPSPEVRLAEAKRAAEVLGAHARITLDLPNRRLFDTFEARVALAKVFRRYQPRLVLSLGSKTPLASPDHYQAMLITEAAVFYTKLTKWEHHFDNVPPCAAPATDVLLPGAPLALARQRKTAWWLISATLSKRNSRPSPATKRSSAGGARFSIDCGLSTSNKVRRPASPRARSWQVRRLWVLGI